VIKTYYDNRRRTGDWGTCPEISWRKKKEKKEKEKDNPTLPTAK